MCTCGESGQEKVCVVVYLTLTDPLRIQPSSQDRRNQTRSNRKSRISRESSQKRTDKKVASKGHRRDKQKENLYPFKQQVHRNLRTYGKQFGELSRWQQVYTVFIGDLKGQGLSIIWRDVCGIG